MDEWSCYIIENNRYKYVGVSNNVEKRLRAHNGEIKGGAKYTTSKGKGWKHICIIRGFPTKIEFFDKNNHHRAILGHVTLEEKDTGVTKEYPTLLVFFDKNGTTTWKTP